MANKALWNFSAGPSKLPTEVLQQAAAEMLDWHGSGMSVMEMSHRGPEFTQICDEAEEDLRRLLTISDDYAVMFMQGGATAENAIVPLNLLHARPAHQADYLVTGIWSAKSYKRVTARLIWWRVIKAHRKFKAKPIKRVAGYHPWKLGK